MNRGDAAVATRTIRGDEPRGDDAARRSAQTGAPRLRYAAVELAAAHTPAFPGLAAEILRDAFARLVAPTTWSFWDDPGRCGAPFSKFCEGNNMTMCELDPQHPIRNACPDPVKYGRPAPKSSVSVVVSLKYPRRGRGAAATRLHTERDRQLAAREEIQRLEPPLRRHVLRVRRGRDAPRREALRDGRRAVRGLAKHHGPRRVRFVERGVERGVPIGADIPKVVRERGDRRVHAQLLAVGARDSYLRRRPELGRASAVSVDVCSVRMLMLSS